MINNLTAENLSLYLFISLDFFIDILLTLLCIYFYTISFVTLNRKHLSHHHITTIYSHEPTRKHPHTYLLALSPSHLSPEKKIIRRKASCHAQHHHSMQCLFQSHVIDLSIYIMYGLPYILLSKYIAYYATRLYTPPPQGCRRRDFETGELVRYQLNDLNLVLV